MAELGKIHHVQVAPLQVTGPSLGQQSTDRPLHSNLSVKNLLYPPKVAECGKNTKNKLGLSCAKLSTAYASYHLARGQLPTRLGCFLSQLWLKLEALVRCNLESYPQLTCLEGKNQLKLVTSYQLGLLTQSAGAGAERLAELKDTARLGKTFLVGLVGGWVAEKS